MAQDLISKIEQLKDIKPREEWVVLTKARILGQAESQTSHQAMNFWSIFEGWRLMTAMAGSMAVLLMVFIAAQYALPGDPLYSLKRITEKSQTAFVSAQGKPRANIELASKRLEELGQIAKNNQVKRLAPAINEFQANVSDVVKDLAKMSATSSDIAAVQGIVEAAEKLEVSKKQVEAMGIVIGGTDELDNAVTKLVQRELTSIAANNLTENQKQTLIEAQEAFEQGDYSAALEKILLMLP